MLQESLLGSCYLAYMDTRTKLLVAIAVLIASFLAYKLLYDNHAPIEFMGETYEFSEERSPNDYVETLFFTPGGKSALQSDRWIQKTTLDNRVTESQRDAVDRQIRSAMRVSPMPGHEDRYFGKFDDAVIHVLLLEYQYILYVYSDTELTMAELKAAAPAIFDEMEITFASGD